jgi:hypothetical protein
VFLRFAAAKMHIIKWKAEDLEGYVGFEVITAVTVKSAVFRDVNAVQSSRFLSTFWRSIQPPS